MQASVLIPNLWLLDMGLRSWCTTLRCVNWAASWYCPHFLMWFAADVPLPSLVQCKSYFPYAWNIIPCNALMPFTFFSLSFLAMYIRTYVHARVRMYVHTYIATCYSIWPFSVGFASPQPIAHGPVHEELLRGSACSVNTVVPTSTSLSLFRHVS